VTYEPDEDERDELDDHVDAIVAELQLMPPALVRAMGYALIIGDRDGPFDYLGYNLAHCWNGEDDFLFHLRLRCWLTPGHPCPPGHVEDALERLDGAEDSPWPAIRRALMACRQVAV
jgi:hypothetical protein